MVSSWQLYACSGALLVAVATYGLFARSGVLKRILAANLLGSGVFLILISIADRIPGEPDAVPHALVLTGIVVAVSATALALALARRMVHEEEETSRSGDDGGSA